MNIEYSLFELKNQSEQLASWSMVVQYSILYMHFDMIRSDWVRHTQSCNLLVFFIIWFQNENPLISVKNGITSIQTLTYKMRTIVHTLHIQQWFGGANRFVSMFCSKKIDACICLGCNLLIYLWLNFFFHSFKCLHSAIRFVVVVGHGVFR